MFWNVIQFIIICFIGSVGFFVYDSIAVLGPYLLDKGFSQVQISLLYNIYYYPNVIFSLFAGLLVDKWGTQKSLLLFSFISVIACVILASSLNFVILLIGRIILGIAAEAIFVCQIKLFTINYPKNSSLIFTLSLVYNRLSSFLAYIILPLIIKASNIHWALYTCLILACSCFIVNIFYYIKTRKDEDVLLEKISIKQSIKYCLSIINFWLMLGWAFFYYGAFMSFTAISPIIIQSTIINSAEKSNQIASMLTFGSVVGSPIIGVLTDKYGYHTLAVSFGILCGIGPFTCLILLSDITQTQMILIMFCLGISYGIVPSLLYRSISFIIPNEYVGTATGLIESVNALAVCIVPVIFSYLYQYNYHNIALCLLVILLGITFIFNIIFGLNK